MSAVVRFSIDAKSATSGQPMKLPGGPPEWRPGKLGQDAPPRARRPGPGEAGQQGPAGSRMLPREPYAIITNI
jgi:hypothetical protein